MILVSSQEIGRLITFVLMYSAFRCFTFPNSHFLKHTQRWHSCKAPRERSVFVEKALDRCGDYIHCLWKELKANLIA